MRVAIRENIIWGILNSVAGILEEMRGLGFRKKKAAAFGAYGWSGDRRK